MAKGNSARPEKAKGLKGQELAQLNGFGAGANKKADPLRSAFLRDSLNGSGYLNLPVIPIWRNKLLPTGIEIVRPPLHHLSAFV